MKDASEILKMACILADTYCILVYNKQSRFHTVVVSPSGKITINMRLGPTHEFKSVVDLSSTLLSVAKMLDPKDPPFTGYDYVKNIGKD